MPDPKQPPKPGESKQLTVAEQGRQTIKQLLARSEKQIQQRLPKHMTADKMIAIALTAANKTPKLYECDPMTFLGCVVQCAQLGLTTDNVLGHAFLVPFRNSRANRYEVQLIVGYKGMVQLAHRSGLVSSFSGVTVYKNDDFSMRLGSDPYLHHIPPYDGDPGEIRGAYATVTFKNGERQFLYMTRKQIEDIRDRSQSYKSNPGSSPWSGPDKAEMFAKTPLRRLSKWIPNAPELAYAAALEDLHDAGESQGLEGLDVEGALDVAFTNLHSGGDAQERVADASAKKQEEMKDQHRQHAGKEAFCACPDGPNGEHLEGCEHADTPTPTTQRSMFPGT